MTIKNTWAGAAVGEGPAVGLLTFGLGPGVGVFFGV
jgi:hypothetical protein